MYGEKAPYSVSEADHKETPPGVGLYPLSESMYVQGRVYMCLSLCAKFLCVYTHSDTCVVV